MIEEISYEAILPYWKDSLWPNRKDPIEPISWMKFLQGYEDNSNEVATYFAWVEDGSIVGVNSGHTCKDGSYRSRGLWVNPSVRGRGIGKELLLATIKKGQDSTFVWSFPKQSSWRTYHSVGFELASDFKSNVNDTNAFCIRRTS